MVIGFSLGSFGRALAVVGYIPARQGSRRDHSASLGSFGRGLGVVRFIWVH